MANPIPHHWKERVVAILRRDISVEFHDPGYTRFRREFGRSGYKYLDLQEAFIEFLEKPNPVGCKVTLKIDNPGGETWEFLFLLDRNYAYGKILLSLDHSFIKIYSAHIPERDTLSCEEH